MVLGLRYEDSGTYECLPDGSNSGPKQSLIVCGKRQCYCNTIPTLINVATFHFVLKTIPTAKSVFAGTIEAGWIRVVTR